MKTWKYGIILMCVSMLVLSSAVVSAETITDGQNDVIKSTGGGTYLSGQTSPEVDIKEITCTIEGTTLTLELEMYGDIQLVSPYAYYVTVETTDFQYSINIFDGSPGASVFDNAGSDYLPDEPEPTIDGTTISAVFETQGDVTIEEIFGHAEYLVQEMLQDWAPDSRNPLYDFINGDDDTGGDDTGGDDTGGDDTGGDDTGGDDTGDEGNGDDDTVQTPPRTPGFETLIMIAAISLAFILIKRRK